MLRNISDKTLDLKWSGVSISLNPGDCCDVTVSFAADILLEDRFMSKFKDKLEQFTPCEIVKESKPEETVEELVNEIEEEVKHRGRPKKR